MDISSIDPGVSLRPLKYALDDAPHATVEPNRTCNLRCRSCYNLDRAFEKPLRLVKQEIDQLVRKRNLQVITILGGEPTLYAHLNEFIRYIKNKRIMVQLLTNGVVFLQQSDDRLLRRLRQSGVDRILLHIDRGQQDFHEDIESARERLFTKMESLSIPFALSLTIYNEDQGSLPGLLTKYSRFRYFDGILAVLARDPVPPFIQKAGLEEEYLDIKQKLNIEPVAYVPSNLSDDKASWLLYFYSINAQTGKARGMPPGLYRLMLRTYRWLRGRHLFVVQTLTRRTKSRFHFIAIQTPPEFNEEKDQLEFCFHCPDATMRNGMLTPVCMADHLSPLRGLQLADIPDGYRETVFSHLGESS